MTSSIEPNRKSLSSRRKSGRRAPDLVVMAQPAHEGCAQPRLRRIELPGMDVEHGRLVVALVDPPHRPPRPGVRAAGGSSRRRAGAPRRSAYGGRRHLEQGAAVGPLDRAACRGASGCRSDRDGSGRCWRRTHSLPRSRTSSAHSDRSTIEKLGARNPRTGDPPAASIDALSRGAGPRGTPAGSVDRPAGASSCATPARVPAAAMRRTSLRIVLGHPAEDEERRRHTRVGEELEHAIGVGLDPALEAIQVSRGTTDSKPLTWK